jgi:hypothetical protein
LESQNLETEAEFSVFEELAPVDEKKNADDDQAGDDGSQGFPISLAVEQAGQIRAGVFAGEDENAVGN